MNAEQVPSLRTLYGTNNQSPIALLRHNVSDLVDLPPEKVDAINGHYGPRAFHQLMATRSGDITAVPGTVDNFHKMRPLLSWARRNLGIDYVVTSTDMDRLPFSDEDEKVVVPYFSSRSFGDMPMWGLNPGLAEELKNKMSFADTIQAMGESLEPVCEAYGMHPTVVLPYESIRHPDETKNVLSLSLESSKRMYDDFARFDPDVADYPLGVVMQQSGGDGGYGTVIMRQGSEEGVWEILAEKGIQRYDSYEEAQQVLGSLVEAAGGTYKVTRYVDLEASPSVGVYAYGEDVMPLPVTIQFFEYGSCVGGASQNSIDERDFAAIKEKEPYMQALSGAIVSNVLDGQVESAHVGVDFMIAGEKEKRLIALMKDHPELRQYASQCMELGIAECNPRMTSLSLSVWPLLLYDNKASGRSSDDITYDDIGAFYGRPNSNGEAGGFAVWDYIDAPEGVKTESELMAWLDDTNAGLADRGLFFVPRLPLEDKDGRKITSVVLGMRPTRNPESADEFKRIISELSNTCSLQSLHQSR